jgi:hypothetical protein
MEMVCSIFGANVGEGAKVAMGAMGVPKKSNDAVLVGSGSGAGVFVGSGVLEGSGGGVANGVQAENTRIRKTANKIAFMMGSPIKPVICMLLLRQSEALNAY